VHLETLGVFIYNKIGASVNEEVKKGSSLLVIGERIKEE
jgi:hypothetical protein